MLPARHRRSGLGQARLLGGPAAKRSTCCISDWRRVHGWGRSPELVLPARRHGDTCRPDA
eukprot:3785836-Alexandrium_andersonii.AAC.1